MVTGNFSDLPRSSSVSLLEVFLESFSGPDDAVGLAFSEVTELFPASVNSCFLLGGCLSCCPCFSWNSMISLVKSLSERSRNKLHTPKSSP